MVGPGGGAAKTFVLRYSGKKRGVKETKRKIAEGGCLNAVKHGTRS